MTVVRRHVREWRRRQRVLDAEVFIPLVFDPREAFQFDWSHEQVEMTGMPVTVKVAQVRCGNMCFLLHNLPH